MIAQLANNIIMICTLSSFPGLPDKLEGRLLLTTKTYHSVVVSGTKGEKVVVSIPKRHCKRK